MIKLAGAITSISGGHAGSGSGSSVAGAGPESATGSATPSDVGDSGTTVTPPYPRNYRGRHRAGRAANGGSSAPRTPDPAD